ncbi:TnsA endonuclease N-terminal domain-containing protein [Azospirillum argentinense]
MRRRIIRPNTRSFTGRHVLPDGSGDIRFESGLERDFLTLLSIRDDVLEIVEQPFSLTLQSPDGKPRRYTPDFKVTYRDRVVVYEVKYREQLRKRWSEYRGKFSQARTWAQANGMRFRIVTELTIRTVRFENARLLAPYRGVAPDPAAAKAIIAGLADGPRTVLDLVRALCPDRADRARFYAAFWPMLANRQLRADPHTPIGMDLRVEVAP